MHNKNRVTTVFILLLLTTLVFLVQGAGLNVRKVYAEQKVEKQDEYPTTPEGVVEAYIKTGFDGTGHEAIGDIKKQLQYTTWDIWPGSDGDYVSIRYRISKIAENDREATVKVIYECLGWVALDMMNIESGTEEIEYKLVKEKGFWRISFPGGYPQISVRTAIKVLEWGIETYKKDTERVKKMKKNIEILRKYLQ